MTKYSPARTYGRLRCIVYTLGKLLEEKVATYVHELKPHGWRRRERRGSQDGNDREEKKEEEEDVMSMTTDETDEAYSPEGRNHTMMNYGGMADDAFYVVTQWPSGREADG